MAQERLQKILARAGVSSRRAAEQLITGGHVRVNGEVVTELGARADTATDRIDVDGSPIAREKHVYYLIHKPRGMVTTLKDPEDRPSLSELLHAIPERVYPVGRLDFHTSGALLLTNDGDLAQALLHPSKAVPKTYVVKLSREADDYMLTALSTGVTLDDGYRTQPARVEHLRDEDSKSWLQITITEGKNRQIHRMIESLDTRVMRLSRISFAGISTEDLRPANIRPLHPEEIAMLKREYQGVEPTKDELERREITLPRVKREFVSRDGREPAKRAGRGFAMTDRNKRESTPREERAPAPRVKRGFATTDRTKRDLAKRELGPREVRGSSTNTERPKREYVAREPKRDFGTREVRGFGAREERGFAAKAERPAKREPRNLGEDILRKYSEREQSERVRASDKRLRASDRPKRDDRNPERPRAAQKNERDRPGIRPDRDSPDRPKRGAQTDKRNTRTQGEKKAPRVDSDTRPRHKTRPT